MDNVDIVGRKAFFIAPPESVVTEEFLEAFFARGYEVYIVEDDGKLPVKEKVEHVIKLYPGSMLFFYIDRTLAGIDWKHYVWEMQRIHGSDILFGVVHDKRADEREDRKLKDYYQQQAALRCGCVALEADKKANFDRFEQIFELNGALGRRKLIRVLCDESSFATLTVGGQKIRAKILDVNMSHFSCDLTGKDIDFSIYDRVLNASLIINGMHFDTDSVLIMKRDKNDVNMHIFMFTQPDGTPELVGEKRENLNHKLYHVLARKFKIQLRSSYE